MHVDLSVLVWFISVGGLLWSLDARRARSLLGRGARLAGAGALAMSLIAPFAGRTGEPVMANFIPVLDGPVFVAAS